MNITKTILLATLSTFGAILLLAALMNNSQSVFYRGTAICLGISMIIWGVIELTKKKKTPENIFLDDALCLALSPHRTRAAVELVLNNFIPKYFEIEGDYAFSQTCELTFKNQGDLLDYLEKTSGQEATIHWNSKKNSPDGIMVGAYFTSDEQLILSLTVLAYGDREDKYLDQLKSILGSDTGIIYYNQFPALVNGEDFKNKYGPQHLQ